MTHHDPLRWLTGAAHGDVHRQLVATRTPTHTLTKEPSMTTPTAETDLTSLAERIAANYGITVLPRLRVEAERDDDDFHPLDPADVLTAYRELVDLAERITEPLPVAPTLATVTDDGADRYISADRATPEDFTNALVTLAAETVALHRAASRAAQQFVGVTRLARRAQEAADAAVASGRLARTEDGHTIQNPTSS